MNKLEGGGICKGKLIVIEGAGDGIGKSTQYAMLRDRLISEGVSVVCRHFPSYGTAQAVLTEKYLRGEFGAPETLSPYVINNIYAVDRMITWQTELRERYENGDLILLDRYTTSSLIYQSAYIKNEEEKRAFIEYVYDFEFGKLGIPKPDAVVYLTAPEATITSLRNKRSSNEGVDRDIHEENGDYMSLIYESAGFVASYLGWKHIECGDEKGGVRSREEIHEEIVKYLRNIGAVRGEGAN